MVTCTGDRWAMADDDQLEKTSWQRKFEKYSENVGLQVVALLIGTAVLSVLPGIGTLLNKLITVPIWLILVFLSFVFPAFFAMIRKPSSMPEVQQLKIEAKFEKLPPKPHEVINYNEDEFYGALWRFSIEVEGNTVINISEPKPYCLSCEMILTGYEDLYYVQFTCPICRRETDKIESTRQDIHHFITSYINKRIRTGEWKEAKQRIETAKRFL